MDVGPTRKVLDSAPLRRSGRASGPQGRSFAPEELADAKTAAALTGTGPIAAVDAILALQGIGEATDGRTRAVRHGEQLLKLLDEVRDGLLAGEIPEATLVRLASAVAKRREGYADAELEGVLDEIELRARVELAKLEQGRRSRG